MRPGEINSAVVKEIRSNDGFKVKIYGGMTNLDVVREVGRVMKETHV